MIFEEFSDLRKWRNWEVLQHPPGHRSYLELLDFLYSHYAASNTHIDLRPLEAPTFYDQRRQVCWVPCVASVQVFRERSDCASLFVVLEFESDERGRANIIRGPVRLVGGPTLLRRCTEKSNDIV